MYCSEVPAAALADTVVVVGAGAVWPALTDKSETEVVVVVEVEFGVEPGKQAVAAVGADKPAAVQS